MSALLGYAAANAAEIAAQTGRHLFLVALSLAVAAAIGVPIGVACAERPRAGRLALAVANVTQTIPSLAMLGFLIPLPLIGGTDSRPALVALMLYALLPIVKNTITGLRGIDAAVREAATAMGMTPRQLLGRVSLPLAAPTILAGVRIAAVVSVGTATIAAAAGAEGLGVFIFRGLATYNVAALLAGAIPAAALALTIDAALGWLEGALTRRQGVAPAGKDR
jgi:osmoprotectant transport system permease protein